MSHPVITGPQNFRPGAPPPRLEIRDLIQNKQMFSLYVLAIKAMSDADQQDEMSHYQIGGIHGLPNIQWGESGGLQPVDPNAWGGYCTHSSVLFPTWHRPYVALYEQSIQQNALLIAAKYTVDNASWVTAAQDLRAPYWDWASAIVPPDEVLMNETITVSMWPDGHDETIPNPLFAYTFHPIDPAQWGDWANWQTTLRNPQPQPPPYDPKAVSDTTDLQNILRVRQDDVTEHTYRTLTMLNQWNHFSDDNVNDYDSKPASSLEAIHDLIHDLSGSGGHMSDLSSAGLDPLFFMHHANVDRLLSLWQALHYKVWVSDGEVPDGSWTLKEHAKVGPETPLTPFWNDQTDYWNSIMVRDWRLLGYTYPDFDGLDMSNPDAVQAAIAKLVNQKYGDPSRFGWSFAAANTGRVKEDAETLARSADPSMAAPQAAMSLFATLPDPDVKITGVDGVHHYYDWKVQVRVKRYEMKGTYHVLVFVGSVPDNSEDWLTSPNLAGIHTSLANAAADRCANCKARQEIVIESVLHLNSTMAQRAGIRSFDPETVEPYLKENLHWRLQWSNHRELDVAEVTSLEVLVVATPIAIDRSGMFPKLGQHQVYTGITHGRPGGHRIYGPSA